ncbi:hypothetical protein QZH41_019822 [Actinostola sp. cb2023]|nr:hypothetical protein QZH41_019822 [Actinostola sp. cb2023]
MESVWSRCGVSVESAWSQSGISMESAWSQRGVGVESEWSHVFTSSFWFPTEMMMKFLSVSEVEDTGEKNHKLYVQKARSMFEKHMNRIPGAYLDLKDISTSSIARESLLSITTERTGSWFKEEIRTLGGLDHIVNAVTECVDWLAEVHGNYIQRDQDSQAKIQRINKSLKLLENITYENAVNQKYLIQYHNGVLARDLARFAKLCISTITEGCDVGSSSSCDDYIYNEATLDDCVFNTLKVLLNLSHDCDEGSNLIGQQPGLLASLLFCVLQLPQHLDASKRFDLHVLSLGLLINLVEHSKRNIATLVQLKTDPCHESQDTSNDSMLDSDGLMGSIEALMQLFIVREKSARDTDQMTNALSPEDEEDDGEMLKPTKDGLGWICGNDIDVSIDESKKTSDEDVVASSSSPPKKNKNNDNESLEDEIGKALVIANKHMEDSMVASYVALLLGCIVQDNKANEILVRSLLPNTDFSLLIDVLKKFLGFMRLTSGTSGHAIERILKVIQKCSEEDSQ